MCVNQRPPARKSIVISVFFSFSSPPVGLLLHLPWILWRENNKNSKIRMQGSKSYWDVIFFFAIASMWIAHLFQFALWFFSPRAEKNIFSHNTMGRPSEVFSYPKEFPIMGKWWTCVEIKKRGIYLCVKHEAWLLYLWSSITVPCHRWTDVFHPFAIHWI